MKHWVGIVLAVVIVLTGSVGFWLTQLLLAQTVYAGVTVANIDVAGRTRDEVTQLLYVWQKGQNPRPILLSYDAAIFRIEPENIDYSIDPEAMADAAWQVGREGSLWMRIKNIRAAHAEGWSIPLKIKYNEDKLDTIIEHLQETVNKPPHNATLSLRAGGIVPEVEGCQIDVAALKELIVAAINRSDASTIILPVKPVYPEITATELARNGIKELVSVYTTVFNTEDSNRTANVKLSAQKINGNLLYPGQIFSYNDTVGPREKAQGFKEAMEIINGEFVPGVGGGVCQVSSTLYNAVLLAGLNIVDRTNHSKPLSYVALGRDATVVYNALDFKFVNNSSAPVMIMAETVGNKLNVGIFGQRALDKTIEVVTVGQQVIQPSIIKKADPALLPGESKVEKEGKPGYEVTVVRIIRDNTGKELKREILSRDRYAPDNTVIKMGPAPKPVQSEVKSPKAEEKLPGATGMQ
ncbi:VanW family protein [Sporomusa malonica]|uniref:Vancomycin resistance protein YoaR, contains peptidoglycan-binding and VanW domains n=1 Tax=Sporomusa malonica TaxID=112901 RepID=A0A1W2EX28_9FIRM|nr:VanW family protein [Sporomusa malonica]SMD14180.1 Vancomycin resistance protein YoaR, contains peptidoglycan-binding and VanW domains [Sporomusa malonica]